MMPAIPHIRGASGNLAPASEGGRSQAKTGSRQTGARCAETPRSWQHLQVLVALPVRDRGQIALPLVALVVVEHLPQAARQRAPHNLVTLQLHQRGAEAVGHALE